MLFDVELMKQKYGSVYSCETGNRRMAVFGGEWGLGGWWGDGETKQLSEWAKGEMEKGEEVT